MLDAFKCGRISWKNDLLRLNQQSACVKASRKSSEKSMTHQKQLGATPVAILVQLV